MALNSLGLGVTFSAQDNLSGVLHKLERAFSGVQMSSASAVAVVGGGLATMAAGIGVFAMGLGGLEAAFNMASSAAAFTAAIQKAGMVAEGVAGQSAKLTEALRETAMMNAMATGFDPTQIATGLEAIAAMGFNAAQSIQMIRPALDLAAGGGISVASATGAMTSAMKVFGLSTNDAGDVADKLKGIADFTGLQAKDLEISLGTVGRGAGMAKQGLDEMLIAMGLVKNTGVDATVAASSVSSALIFMAKNAAKFKALGVEVENADGSFRDFGDVVLDTGKAMEGGNKGAAAQVQELTSLFQRFGVTAFQGVYGQLKSGVLNKSTGEILYLGDALKYMRGQMGLAAEEDRAKVFAEAMLGTFDGLHSKVKATWEVIKINIGEGFESLLKPVLRLINGALQTLGEMFMHMTPGIKKLGAALFVAAGIMTMAAGAALILTGAFAVLAGGIILGGAPLLAFLVGIVAVAVPAMAIAVALTGVILALGAGIGFILANNIGGSADKLKAEFTRWKLIFESVVGFLSEGKLTGALAEEFMNADAATQGFIVKATLFFEKIKAFAVQFYEDLKFYMGAAVPHINALGSAFLDLAEALGLTESSYLATSETMAKGEFQFGGRKAAESFTKVFIFLADAITMAVQALAWFIDKWSMAIDLIKWGSGYTAVSSLFGLASDAGAGGGEENTRPRQGMFGSPYGQTAEERALPPEIPGLQSMMPAVAAAEGTAEREDTQTKSTMEQINDLRSKIDGVKKTYVFQSVLDGRVIAESVMSIADEDRAGSFAGGQLYASSED